MLDAGCWMLVRVLLLASSIQHPASFSYTDCFKPVIQTTTAESKNYDEKIILLLIVANSIRRHSLYVMENIQREDDRWLKIVVAEDAKGMRYLLQEVLLEVYGVVICGVAENGIEALRLIKEHRPDVVLLDISMPYMDGIQVMKEIRTQDQSTVIIIWTVDHSLRKFCLSAGADFFLQKTQIQKLIEILERLVEKKGFKRH
jgi:CheY-like chemotaxis protein